MRIVMRMASTTSRKRSNQRRSLNLSVRTDLIDEARRQEINLSRFLENCLLDELKRRWQDRWLEGNREAIDDFNERIEKEGVFSDGLRRF